MNPGTGQIGFSGYSPTVSLSEAADQAGVGVHERTALRTQFLREWVAGGIMLLFILANALMLYAVYRLVWPDQRNLECT